MQNKKWVAGWGTSVTVIAQCHADYIKDQTFRYVFYPTMNATAVRIHFSNEYGEESATINEVYLAKRTSGEYVDASTNRQVTFGGKNELTLLPGETCVSDEIEFDVHVGEEFDVSMYFKDFTQMVTGHHNNGYYIKKYYGKGDHAASAEIPLKEYGEGGPYAFINTIDFLTDADDDCKAIVAFGDSITAQPWPDCLSRRIVELGITNRSIVRKAIGGSRMLRSYTYRIKTHWGVPGIERFERDVVQAGVEKVFVLHGINDIIHPNDNNRLCPMSELPEASEMIENGYKKYIEIAHKHGIKIYLATILPYSRNPAEAEKRESIRMAVNEWIRTNDLCDGVIDFEEAVRNPDNPKEMLAEYDSGDHLHPSLAGAKRLADFIPVELITE